MTVTLTWLAEALRASENTIRGWIPNCWLQATERKAGARVWTIIKPEAFEEFCKQHDRKVVGNRLNLGGSNRLPVRLSA